jgi:pimeloyl-ACP methyl ester carboxylesterase
VIFLHGGPGVPDMRGDSEYFGRLARDGFEVYVYDMVGTGRSSRLADPRGYTLGRDVADLEAIREKIGAERVFLVGHSYGGTLAAAYAASYPERVVRMVLSFPGDPSPSAGGASMVYRLTTKEKLGFYANQYPQSATREPHENFLPDLSERDIPTLVIKGRRDYLSWSSAQEYLVALPDVRLLYLDGSGHNAYQDEPERYMANLRAFLLGEALPQSPYEGHRMPDDYEGPK